MVADIGPFTSRLPFTFPPVIIRAIEPRAQRYATVGDWQNNEGLNTTIDVSKTGVGDYDFLLALHEFVEWYLCFRSGVTQEEVDDFDQHFEATNQDGEPGDDARAPYHMQHQFAEIVERLAAHHMGVNWSVYEDAINRAYQKTKRALKAKTPTRPVQHGEEPGK